MSFTKITHPITGDSYSLLSKQGKTLLKTYVNLYQNGGADGVDGALYNQKTVALLQFANFKLNILLMGEGHAHIGHALPGGGTLTQEMSDNISKYVRSIVTGMNKTTQ